MNNLELLFQVIIRIAIVAFVVNRIYRWFIPPKTPNQELINKLSNTKNKLREL